MIRQISRHLLRFAAFRLGRFAGLRRTVGAVTRRMPFLHAKLVALVRNPSIRASGKVVYALGARDAIEDALPVDARRIYRSLLSKRKKREGSR